jgi:hypothetical protein
LGKYLGISRIQLPVIASVRYHPDEGDPPGVSGSPYQFYPPGQPGTTPNYGGYTTDEYNIPFRCRFLVRSREGEILYNSGFESFDVVDDGAPSYLPSPSLYRYTAITAGHSFDVTFSPILEEVAWIEVELTSTEPRNWGIGWFPMNVSSAPVTRVVVSPTENGAGGPTITVENEVINGRRLYLVGGYNTSPVWTDVTPGDGRVPMENDALFVNPLDETELICVGTNASGDRKVYKSDNGGSSWTSLDLVAPGKYQRAKRFGNAIALYGYASFDITDDDGVSVHDRLGNWSRGVGPIGDTMEVLFPNDNPYNWP